MRSVAKLVDIFTAAIGFVLGFRIILKFLGASTRAPFVQWLYDFTGGMMAPFEGIFPTPVFGRVSVIDVPAFFAMIVYLLAGYFISELLDSLDNPVSMRKRMFGNLTRKSSGYNNPGMSNGNSHTANSVNGSNASNPPATPPDNRVN